ncbi:MAG: carbohydrate ABC transporter permease [Candidatus Hadarchaeum sp.]|uniref:carbohydrate ABC transporter permease n=1 Tax=Candidatus Hadarchaeum sp. TaxID=2883567 RepID=UPI00317D4542
MKMRSRLRWQQTVIYVLLVTTSVFAVAPLIWGIVTSFKPYDEIFQTHVSWWPRKVTLQHYMTVVCEGSFAKGGMIRAICNSMLVSIAAAMLSTMFGICSAYYTARMKKRFWRAYLLILLGANMTPMVAILVPLFFLVYWFRLYDTYMSMILVHTALRLPFSAWILHGFLLVFPWELEEAALVDGCSRLRAFLYVAMPILRPGLAAAGLLAALYVWQDFLIGFTLVQRPSLRVSTVALYDYLSQFGIQWGELMAATTLAAIPLLVAFYAFQKQLIAGLAYGSEK